MKYSLLLLLYLSLLLQVKGQDVQSKKTALTVGYYGETLTHLGVNLGIEHYPHQTDRYQMIIAVNIGGYVHRRNNTSLFVRTQWGQRLHFKSGLFLEQFIGLGYLHQFLHGGDLYEVLPNGAVVENSNNGEPKVMPSISLGIGHDFSDHNTHRLKVYFRPEIFWKAPFNGYYLTHFAFSIGIIKTL